GTHWRRRARGRGGSESPVGEAAPDASSTVRRGPAEIVDEAVAAVPRSRLTGSGDVRGRACGGRPGRPRTPHRPTPPTAHGARRRGPGTARAAGSHGRAPSPARRRRCARRTTGHAPQRPDREVARPEPSPALLLLRGRRPWRVARRS